MQIQIYHDKKRLEAITQRIASHDLISSQNKKLIEMFKAECFAHNIGAARIVRYMYALRDMAAWLGMDFDKCESNDLKLLVSKIEQMDKYAPRTKYEYRATLKKFYKWITKEDKPTIVNWIDLRLKRHNNKLPSELLTESDVLSMVEATPNPRDRAMIMGLYESGCRIGEFIKIRIRDLIFEKPGCIFFVQGKTGGRRVRVISSEPYIIDWLNRHPEKNNPEAFLWIQHKTRDMLEYPAFVKALRVAARRAKIPKKVNPHNFRHSRATYLAARFTEQQLKVFFGWTRSSEMAAVYVHLSGKDVDDALLTTYGLKEAKNDVTELKPLNCSRCKTDNERSNRFCKLCGTVLDEQERIRQITEQSSRSETDKLMDLLIRDKDVLTLLLQKIKEVKA